MRAKFYTVIALTIAFILNCVLSAPTKQTHQTASFMLRFGYLPDDDNDKIGGALNVNSEEFRASVRNLQRFGNIPVTGRIDAATLKLINTDRCGMKDTRSNTAGRFNLQGTIWKKTDLTYRILNYTRDGIPIGDQRRIFRTAFYKWQSVSGLTIREVDSGDADILISFVRQIHGDPYPFDRKGGTLAHAFYPHSNEGLSGDAHFDDDETFSTGTSEDINLDWVAIHEFGHSLGLEHSNVQESIMYPWYKGYIRDIQLTNDDIKGIQALYPKPTVRETPSTVRTTTKATTTKRPRVTPRPVVITRRPVVVTRRPVVVTRRPVVVTRRVVVTPRPTVPDVCSSTTRYDTVFVGPNRWTYFVVGDKFWIMDFQLRRRGPLPISRYWRDIKTPLDAAYRNKRGHMVFFKGSEFWQYDSRRKLRDSGNITRYGLPSKLANMNAVFKWEGNIFTYFFKGSEYWRYDERTQRADTFRYPKPIKSAWKFPGDINAAVHWVKNRKTYVFRGKQYMKLKRRSVQLERGYPRVIADGWMRCNSRDRDLGTDEEEP